MPMKVKSVAMQRRELVDRIRSGEWTVTHAARVCGISRKTVYRYLERSEDPFDTLEDRSRQPHHSPTRTAPEIEQIILTVARAYPCWGGDKVLAACRREYPDLEFPSARSAARIMDRNDHHPGGQRIGPKGWQRFESPVPNHSWQMDFKGWFRTTDRQTIYPLSVLDEYSRYLVGLEVCTNQMRDTVKTVLIQLFRTYGLPERILADNGPPWGAPGQQAPTGLALWLAEQGIPLLHGHPYHPQTQGKVERFHGTLERELLRQRTFPTVEQTRTALAEYRTTYNTMRIHQAIGNRYPDDLYTSSPRMYRDTIDPPHYPDALAVRTVAYNGTIAFANRRIRVHTQLLGKVVGLYPGEGEDEVDILYYQTIVRNVNLNTISKRNA